MIARLIPRNFKRRGKKPGNFSLFFPDVREGKTTHTGSGGCIGTSLSGSWRPSCGSCPGSRLFPTTEVRTGQESSASNITPPATKRNVRTYDLSRNLARARRTRRVLVSLRNQRGGSKKGEKGGGRGSGRGKAQVLLWWWYTLF